MRFASASGLAASAVPAAWLPVVVAAWLSLCAAPLQPWLPQPVLQPCCVLLLDGVVVCVVWSVRFRGPASRLQAAAYSMRLSSGHAGFCRCGRHAAAVAATAAMLRASR